MSDHRAILEKHLSKQGPERTRSRRVVCVCVDVTSLSQEAGPDAALAMADRTVGYADH